MANNLQVTLSFKPIMDGLNRFTSAFQRRMEAVRAFNLRIENGARATNDLISQAAAALGGAKIAQTFASMIKGGVGFNEQLEQANLGIAAVLKQFDSAGQYKTFEDALAASSAAIDLLKQKAKESPASFSDLVQAFQGTAGAMAAANIPLQKQVDLVVGMSQALAGLGIRSEQILQETRALITGNINADAAAAKILGVTSADIAQAKQKGQLYEFLSGKIASFGEAARRGAGSLATLRSNFGDSLEQRAARATERLNEALKGMYATLTRVADSPAFGALIDRIGETAAAAVGAVTTVAGFIEGLGPNGAVVISTLTGQMAFLATVTATILLPLVAIRGILAGLPAFINPLRAGFVGLAGINFAAAIKDLNAYVGGWGLLTTINVSTWAQRATMALSLVGAALVGWELGKFINELTVAGAKVKDWAAMLIVIVQDKLGAAWSTLQKAWISVRSDWDSMQLHIRATAVQMAITIAEAFNRIPGLPNIDTTSWHFALARLQSEIAGLDATERAARAAVDERRAEQRRENAELLAFMADSAFGFAPPERGDRSKPKPTPAAVVRNPAAELQQAKDAIELERFWNEQAYEKKLIDLEVYLANRHALLQRSIDAERKSDKPPSRPAVALLQAEEAAAQARLRREIADKERQLQFAEQEQLLSERLGDLALQRAAIESDRYLTAEQKQAKLLPLLEEENRLLADKIAKLDTISALEADPEKRLQFRKERESTAEQKAANTTAIADARPQTIEQGIVSASVGLQDQIGSVADQVGNAWRSTAETMRTSMGGAFADMILKAQSFSEASLGFIQAVGTAAVQNGAQMVADWIMNHEVMTAVKAAFTATDVGTHVAGEAAKTGATATGATARKGLTLGETIFAGVQWVIRTAAHLAGETANTAVTLAQKAIRLPAILAESGAYLAKAAVGAMSAMASIPYVGPILAIAAMGAILAAGAKLVQGFATGGLVEGPGTATSDSIPARLSDGEFVNRAAVVDRFGVPFFEKLNAGVLDLAALPKKVVLGLLGPALLAPALLAGPSGESDRTAGRDAGAAVAAFATGGLVEAPEADFASRVSSGLADLAALPANVTAGMALPPETASAAATGGGSPAGGGAGASGGNLSMEEIAQRITVIQVAGEREATRIARQSRARGDIVRIVSEDFGIPPRR